MRKHLFEQEITGWTGRRGTLPDESDDEQRQDNDGTGQDRHQRTPRADPLVSRQVYGSGRREKTVEERGFGRAGIGNRKSCDGSVDLLELIAEMPTAIAHSQVSLNRIRDPAWTGGRKEALAGQSTIHRRTQIL